VAGSIAGVWVPEPGADASATPDGGATRSAWHFGHLVASGWIRSRQWAHLRAVPEAKAKARPNGPSNTPRPNQRQPLAPRLCATNAAPIPQKIQTTTASSISPHSSLDPTAATPTEETILSALRLVFSEPGPQTAPSTRVLFVDRQGTHLFHPSGTFRRHRSSARGSCAFRTRCPIL
jgi:hypothetical protein